jgi:hypothetical protein
VEAMPERRCFQEEKIRLIGELIATMHWQTACAEPRTAQPDHWSISEAEAIGSRRASRHDVAASQ